MPKPGSRKPIDDEEDEDALFAKGAAPAAEEDWGDEDEDPMEDNSLDIDEEEAY